MVFRGQVFSKQIEVTGFLNVFPCYPLSPPYIPKLVTTLIPSIDNLNQFRVTKVT